MRVSITVVASDVAVTSDFFNMDVFPDMSLNDIKALVEAEIHVPASAQHYIHDSQPLNDGTKTLTELNINEGDVLSLAVQTQRRQQNTQRTTQTQQPQNAAQGIDPERMRLHMLGDPRVMQEVQRQFPELAEAVQDSSRFQELWNERQRLNEQAQQEKEEQMRLLEADPFNIEAQTKIEEMIRQERVQENLQKAMEENPESFGRVTMLYIDVLVNNIPIKAFVDSGAQTTIMSPDAAQRCGIMRLIDRRWGGIARGVGTAKILGRVHSGDIQIGQYNLASSFTVMEGKDVDLLLGLDMLKRHQMMIDLKENCLRVGNDKVAFLAESEIPKMMEEKLENEPKIEGPGGMTIGAETGTVDASGMANSSATSSKKPEVSSQPPQTTTSASSQQAAASSNSAFGQSGPVTAESIAKVMELGFSREEAVAALQQVNGNVELAVGLLL